MTASPEATRPAPLRASELGALVGAARGRGWTAVRNRALVALLAGSGLKLGQALVLRPADVLPAEGRLRVGAGDEARTVPLLPAAAPHVEGWLRLHAELVAHRSGPDSEQPLFCTRTGGPLESSYVRRLLPRLARAAGLERPVNAGLLRATFAAHLLEHGAALEEVQAVLGHADPRSTRALVAPALIGRSAAGQGETAPSHGAPSVGTLGVGTLSSGATRGFDPRAWCLPGADGALRIEVVLREDGSAREPVLQQAATGPVTTGPVSAGSVIAGSVIEAPVPPQPAQGDTRKPVRPVRWREL